MQLCLIDAWAPAIMLVKMTIKILIVIICCHYIDDNHVFIYFLSCALPVLSVSFLPCKKSGRGERGKKKEETRKHREDSGQDEHREESSVVTLSCHQRYTRKF